MALQGDLQTLSVRALLGCLAGRRASGRLSLSRGMVVRRFHLRDGQVVRASSTEEWTRLGRLLAKRSLIDEAQLAPVLQGTTSPRVRLGKTLVEAGLVTTAQLSGVLADKARSLLLDAMTWNEGSFYFDDSEPARQQESASIPLDLFPLIELNAAALTSDDHGREELSVNDADVIQTRALVKRRRPGRRKTPRPTARSA